jgi:hypothetical protein
LCWGQVILAIPMAQAATPTTATNRHARRGDAGDSPAPRRQGEASKGCAAH